MSSGSKDRSLLRVQFAKILASTCAPPTCDVTCQPSGYDSRVASLSPTASHAVRFTHLPERSAIHQPSVTREADRETQTLRQET